MLEPVIFIAPLGTWVLGKWMSKNPNVKSNDDGDEEDDDDVDDDDGDDDETLRRSCCVKRLTRHIARVPFEGGKERGGRGGSLSPGRSRIRGPARPFASQSKTQGSPLGGYLSWSMICRKLFLLMSDHKYPSKSVLVRIWMVILPQSIIFPHRMVHSLPHNLKNLCHSQITTAHRHLSTYVHIFLMKFLCGLQRFVPFFMS